MYNEASSALECAEKLCTALEKYGNETSNGYEIIFSNDGSVDGCDRIIEDFAKAHPEVRLIGDLVNRGKGYAVKRAVLESRGDVVVYTDCDLAYGTDVIADAAEVLCDGEYDLLVGSRNLTSDGYGGYGFLRRAASKVYIKFLSCLGGLKLTDSQCGFKVLRSQSAKKLFSLCECEGFAFDYEMILLCAKAGMKTGEYPVKILTHKESKVHLVKDSILMMGEFIKIKRRVSKINIW